MTGILCGIVILCPTRIFLNFASTPDLPLPDIPNDAAPSYLNPRPRRNSLGGGYEPIVSCRETIDLPVGPVRGIPRDPHGRRAVPDPTPNPSGEPPLPVPASPSVSTPREAELEARVQQLEAMVRQLSTRLDQVASPAASTPPGITGAEGNVGPVVGGAAGRSPTSGPSLGPAMPANPPESEGMPTPPPAGTSITEPFGTVGSAERPPAPEATRINMPATNPRPASDR